MKNIWREKAVLGLSWLLLGSIGEAAQPMKQAAEPVRLGAVDASASPLTTPLLAAPLWEAPVPVRSGVAASGGKLYYLGTSGNQSRAYAADATTGALLWQVDLGDTGRAFPLVREGGVVVVASYDDSLRAVSPQGEVLWRTRLGGDLYASPALLPDGSVVAATAGGRLYRVGVGGEVLWRTRLGAAGFSSPAVSADGQRIYVGNQAGQLRAYGADGVLQWAFQAGRSVFSSPALDAAGNVYFGSADGYLYSLDCLGRLRWKAELGGFVNAPPVLDGHKVVVGSSSGRLAAFDLAGSPLWSLDAGAPIAAAATLLADGSALVGDQAGTLHRVYSDGTTQATALGGRIDLPVTVLEGAAGTPPVWLVTAGGTLRAYAGEVGAAVGPWPAFRAGPLGQGQVLVGSSANAGEGENPAASIVSVRPTIPDNSAAPDSSDAPVTPAASTRAISTPAAAPLPAELPRLLGGRLHLPLEALAEAYSWAVVPPPKGWADAGTLTLEQPPTKGNAPKRLEVAYQLEDGQPYAALSTLGHLPEVDTTIAPSGITLTLGNTTREWALDWLLLYSR